MQSCWIYFGLNEVWTNKWKGGLRIHEAIVQERTAANYASASNTRSDEPRGKEIAADDSTSTSEKPPIDSEVQEVQADLELTKASLRVKIHYQCALPGFAVI
ncbi:hypothetical protein NC652_020240 [Populus alba x Populus x berolinensis]|nr:hypothetical protein NC652_020240 [Populus alba x Populus x berolinensis]